MPDTNGNNGVNDRFLHRYRELLDAEGAAFDELEHAYEDGDRAHFEEDLAAWKAVVTKRRLFLERSGLIPEPVSV